MTAPYWRIEDPEPDPGPIDRPQPVLVSLHFLRTALRRQWRVWVGLACAGMMLANAWTFVVPGKSLGTVTLLLAHDPGIDRAQAMATDMSLVRTRTVAASVVDRLGLEMAPEELQESFTATPVSSNVLVLEISAPNDKAAVTRARALSQAFLRFRTAQLEYQADALTEGYQKRLASLQQQADRLTRMYGALSERGAAAHSEASEVLTRRSKVNDEISRIRQTIEDTRLRTTAVVAASHVLDPASVVPDTATRRFLLALASGLIGGMAVGIGLVLFTALTSDRLRRREEVALALGAPVRFSVGKLRHRRPWSRGSRRASPERNLQVLVHGLDSAISPGKGRPTRLALATVDRGAGAELVVEGLVAELTLRGLAVFVVDLSESGRLARETSELSGSDGPRPPRATPAAGGGNLSSSEKADRSRKSDPANLEPVQRKRPSAKQRRREREDTAVKVMEPRGSSLNGNDGVPGDDPVPTVAPVVFRPEGVPSLARGPIGTPTGVASDLPLCDPRRPAWDAADVVLTLADVDPAIGADHLRSWADQVVVMVTAGRSSAERLRTAAELIRAAGLELSFAMMVGADTTDESLGLPDMVDTGVPRSTRA